MREPLNSLRKEWQRRIPSRWRIFVIAAIAGPLAAFLFAWSGFYNVAASRGHYRIFEWALAFVMSNSVETHAALIKPPPLNDPNGSFGSAAFGTVTSAGNPRDFEFAGKFRF